MANARADRQSALSGLKLVHKPGVVEILDAGPSKRWVYRGSADALGEAYGVRLPIKPCRAVSAGERAALWLGPDEWLLISPGDADTSVVNALRTALARQAASLVDVSARNFGLLVSGARSADVLASGCPLDFELAQFPIGQCVRTLYGKCEVVIWRSAEETFRLEAWRSFARYLTGLLDLAAGQLPQEVCGR